MKDYASMSDLEIAEKVGKAIGLHSIAGDLYIKSGVWTRFDPCNNPADAWPIIVENRIRVNPVLYTKWMAEDYLEDISHSGENPLRCAMVVFLMMKESEND